jgi:Pyruvate/2-oxoacid:ferredoxin oxidoreductase gamma subunit
MDICQTVAVNGAGFVARATAFDPSLANILAQAIRWGGFALVDVWELCTAYYAPTNKFSKTALQQTLQQLNFPTGILRQVQRPEYSRAIRQVTAKLCGQPVMPARSFTACFTSSLTRPLRCVLAGAAGKKINTAAAILARGAVLSGLWATQRNEYPVTVKSGFSVSEVILSPEEIRYTGIDRPDLMLVMFREGLATVRYQLQAMAPQGIVFTSSDLLPLETAARVVPIDFKRYAHWASKKEAWMLMACAKAVLDLGIYPIQALQEAVGARAEYAEENLKAINAILG